MPDFDHPGVQTPARAPSLNIQTCGTPVKTCGRTSLQNKWRPYICTAPFPSISTIIILKSTITRYFVVFYTIHHHPAFFTGYRNSFHLFKVTAAMISRHIRKIYSLKGSRITTVYEKNRMGIHNQGHYLSVSSPQAIAQEGTLTLSVTVSPYGTVTGIKDAGALIFLNDNPLRLASVPFIRIDDGSPLMLTFLDPSAIADPDDFPLPGNYYYPPIPKKYCLMSIATPLAELRYELPGAEVTRRIVPPLFSDGDQFTPVSVEEFLVTNITEKIRKVTLVVPMPSLVNLSVKKSRPREQDYTFLGSAAVRGQVHRAFSRGGITGVQMGSSAVADRMVIAVPQNPQWNVATQEAFRLRNYNQDLVLNDDGSFHHENAIVPDNDYGAAVSITFTLAPKSTVTVPVAKVFDFPVQRYNDGVTVKRRYCSDYPYSETSAMDIAVKALAAYREWLDRTVAIQKNMVASVMRSAACRDDEKGALRIVRLLLNELSYLSSNASVLDASGQARFLECFDYPFNNSADVDFYSKLLMAAFPEIERDLCRQFVDSINKKDEKFRFYHSYIGDPVRQRDYLDEIAAGKRTAGSDIHIYAKKKEEGSVYHDLGSLTYGNALRNRSEYTWYNTSYWIDLFPKLALRVLRDAKYTGDTALVTGNWATLKKGFNYLVGLDYDGDGIPEGRPGEVRNTYDNIPFAGVDVYDANLFVASLLAMIRMAEITGDLAEKTRFETMLVKAQATYDTLWFETAGTGGSPMAYYITCAGTDAANRNSDVFTDQLVGLWQWIAMGERPFLPQDRVVRLLKTVYRNNRTPMGWATARKQDGSPVDSDQGKDVWIASNYVLAQMLDYYGLIEESSEVFKMMDCIIFDYGNSLNTAESVRPEYERQEGERRARPHYIVASYPRPGAVYDTLFLGAIKREWKKNPDAPYIGSEKLQEIRRGIFGV